MLLYGLNPVTNKEIYKALTDMHPEKAPGPDGFSAMFFRRIGKWWGQKLIGQSNLFSVLVNC